MGCHSCFGVNYAFQYTKLSIGDFVGNIPKGAAGRSESLFCEVAKKP